MHTHRLHVLLAALAAVMSLAATTSVVWASNASPLLMNALFRDHAVLQRGRPIPVWGHAEAGQTVTVSIDGKRASARADAHGRWRVQLPALSAGAPYTRTEEPVPGETQAARDVLVGDVWLCSGQSNMELPLKRTLNWPNEVANAHDGTIRMLIVGKHASATPRANFAAPAAWQKASPGTVADFSATCYYFARALKKHIDVLMGLIDASWGGAKIQAWMSAKALRNVGGYGDTLDILAEYATDPVAANARWGKLWESWWRKHPGSKTGDEPWKPTLSSTTGWHKAPPGLGGWNTWNVPELAKFTGMVWLRTTVTLSAAQAAKGAVLSMGKVDEIDETWVNGRAVGSAYIGTSRNYRLPQGLLHAGTNTNAVNVHNTYSEDGIHGHHSPSSPHNDVICCHT